MSHFRYSAVLCASAALLAGCGELRPPIGAPGLTQHSAGITAPKSPTSSYRLLYSFRGSRRHDGAKPFAGLLNVNGALYGTTVEGGSHNAGAIFTITAGTERVLYSFAGGADGAYPFARLINVKGTLYGTTSAGGGQGCLRLGCGTVFSVTTTGAEKVLYSFGSGSDGADPASGLISVNGTLYGTTAGGGSRCHGGCGTVFSVTTTGTEKVLHSFGDTPDGNDPNAGLINVNGTLYGTTSLGGAKNAGTVFSVTTTGKEKVLYSFGGGSDGADPQANLINVKGTLYGTTSAGGGKGCLAPGCGTVFSVTSTGTKKVVYTFRHGPHGANPYAGLINVNGVLYGTTVSGGSGCGRFGCGAIFSVTTTGREKVLYSFGGGTDGVAPEAGLINVNGTLYGTTSQGGGYGCRHSVGCGTVFALTL